MKICPYRTLGTTPSLYSFPKEREWFQNNLRIFADFQAPKPLEVVHPVHKT